MVRLKSCKPCLKVPFFQSFFGQERGTSIVEFALIVPVFCLVLFAAIQIGIIMVLQNALEAAAREAARYGITGQAASGLSRDESIKQRVLSVLSSYSGNIINPVHVTITVTAYPNLSNLESNTQAVNNTFGISGQAVLYTISYPWDTLFPLFGPSSILTLKGVAPVVNEYY